MSFAVDDWLAALSAANLIEAWPYRDERPDVLGAVDADLGAAKAARVALAGLVGIVRPAFHHVVPAKIAIHAVLDRRGLVKRGGGRRHRAHGTPLSPGLSPNDLWCADFTGDFKLGNGRYCFPLTVSDHAARFLLLSEAFDSTREDPAMTAFERLFRERGLPLAIHCDHGGSTSQRSWPARSSASRSR